ncbi:inversin isoform X2 [Rhineura floridana]|uniref:inversin isoform X2 n=1 Tax=Rhineura floridana TaxID=261503 RepID=UPI002AC85AFD|nr:inversin isoform X2 [Rhineura floridana]
MNDSKTWLLSGSSLASQVHAAAVNGHKSALLKQIAGNPDLKNKEDQFGRTPLMYCVLADRLDCAEALLKAGTDVNKADLNQRTALHLAAQKGNYRFMKLLLARRANWMKKDMEEITPLHLATQHKNPKCLALLLKYMAPGEVDTQDKNKQTALHWSAYYNNPEHVKLLIKHDSNIGIPDIEGKIPLHWAANHKHLSAVHTVKCILDAAPTESLLNWQDYEGRTPLHFAVADGNVAVVDLLTSYEGCNVTSYDNLFRTPLHWAALLERNKFGTIPSDSQGATPLHYAAQSNFAETVEAFLKHASVKDDSDLEGRTSFMWAAGKGSNDVIQTMLNLKLDIDINMADKYGGTALHAAALSGHVSTVQLLLKHDAHVDATDVMKHTPLFRACEMGHKEVIQTLIKGGARVDLVDQGGHSPLHWAALGGNPDVCQILIENKINPNVQDYAGRTPLQCAAYGGYINCMVVLLENNADPNIQDKEGRTALHWLCNNGYLDAIKLLLGFGAFPNHMENNEERYTPLDYALLGAHHEVIQFMLEHSALSIAAIQDIAAVKIQAVYKGYKVRKAFQDRKNLLMKHEQLRKDAAAKKREEENRRRATELQKEMQNSKFNKVHVRQQDISEAEMSHIRLQTTQCSIQQGDAHGERYHSGNMSENQPEISTRTSATVLPNKATIKDKCNSVEVPGEDQKRNMEVSRANSKCKSHSSKESDERQVISATSSRDGKKHKAPNTKANDTFMHARKRHDSSSKAACSGEKSENQSLSINDDINQCKETGVCVQNTKCTGGNTRNSRHCEMALKGNLQQENARSKELNDEKWCRAGASRPGSAKVRSAYIRKDSSSVAVIQTNKLTRNKVCPLLASDARTTRLMSNKMALDSGCRSTAKLDRQALTAPQTSEHQMCFHQHNSTNIEAIPFEVWMQAIGKERARKELFQKKNCAADIIQRAWRSYQLRRQFLQLFSVKRQCKEDEDKWQQDTTAFCIEVAWNKRLNHNPLKSVSSGKNLMNKSNSGLNCTQKSSTLKQIYGRSREGRVYHPMRVSSSKSELQILSASGLQHLCLLESTGKVRQFSSSVEPTTVKTKHTRSRHESKTKL